MQTKEGTELNWQHVIIIYGIHSMIIYFWKILYIYMCTEINLEKYILGEHWLTRKGGVKWHDLFACKYISSIKIGYVPN